MTGEFGIAWRAEIVQYHPYHSGVVVQKRRWYNVSFFLKDFAPHYEKWEEFKNGL